MMDAASWRPMLMAVPVQNSAARVDGPEGDHVVIHVLQERPWYMVAPISWIVPFSAERAVTLDRIGSRLWRLCDGERTVEMVIDGFGEMYGLTFHEARIAVTGYLKTLIQRGILAITMTPDELEKEETP